MKLTIFPRLILLSVLTLQSALADLPNFTRLVKQHAAAVVNVSTTPKIPVPALAQMNGQNYLKARRWTTFSDTFLADQASSRLTHDAMPNHWAPGLLFLKTAIWSPTIM